MGTYKQIKKHPAQLVIIIIIIIIFLSDQSPLSELVEAADY